MLAPDDVRNRQPVLICVGGLPATGKTTIARKLAAELGAAYVRIDTIETAIGRAEGRFEEMNGWEFRPATWSGTRSPPTSCATAWTSSLSLSIRCG